MLREGADYRDTNRVEIGNWELVCDGPGQVLEMLMHLKMTDMCF